MYGVTKDLDLSVFEGTTLAQIRLGQHQIQFDFEPTASLTVEGTWELLDATGEMLDRSQEHTDREFFRLHRCLGESVVKTVVAPPDSISLVFENGCTLNVVDDSKQYESFHVEPGGIHI